MNNALKHLFSPFKDEESLRYAVDLVCATYGKVESLRIFPATKDIRGEGRQCLCLLQLDQPKAEAPLGLELKVSTFGNDLAFVADVSENWTDPTR